MERLDCHYANTPERGFHFEKIELNRRALEQGTVDGFNKTLPAVRMTEEYLHIPPPLPANIEDMR